MQNNLATDIDSYIEAFPKDVQKLLQQLRTTIRKAAPGATEKMSYAIPTFEYNGNLVHFAAYKTHIGFYPAPSGIKKFQKELSHYKGAKGSVQFPIDEPLPLDLIKKIVAFRLMENMEKATDKGTPRGQASFLSTLSAPARRALEAKGIKTEAQLARYSEKDILALHGVGPASLPVLRKALEGKGLSFKNR